MAKITKKQKSLEGKVDSTKLYPIDEALNLVKECATAKFDESIDVAVQLGVDAKKSDQVVRGAVVMPNGTGKTKRVAVFAQGAKAEEAKAAGAKLKARGLKFDIAFTSVLKRAQKTCQHILDAVGQSDLETVRDQALNERDYGELSGLNKDDARQKWGEDQVHVWRRSYDVPPPGGESLKDTGARVWPYYLHTLQPHVLSGGTVLVAAHGNSLRALVKHLSGIPDDEIVNLEIPTGQPIVYELDDQLNALDRYYLSER